MTRDELRVSCEAFVRLVCPYAPPVEQTRVVLRLMAQFEWLGHITPSPPPLAFPDHSVGCAFNQIKGASFSTVRCDCK